MDYPEIKPEDLKRLAEYMGYIIINYNLQTTFSVMRKDESVDSLRDYSPHLTNAEQCLEIMEKLDIFTSTDEDGTKLASCPPHRGDQIIEAKTIPEAVTLAAISAITGE